MNTKMLSKMKARLPNMYDVQIVDRGVGLQTQRTGGGPAGVVVVRELEVMSTNQRAVFSRWS